MDHPSRYALVELENVHDEGLEFEPIHRVLFGAESTWFQALQAYFSDLITIKSVTDQETMVQMVKFTQPPQQAFGIIDSEGFYVAVLSNPSSNLPVGSLQSFLDNWLKSGGAEKIDYVHGEEVVCSLGSQAGHLGFYLPAMSKNELFRTVILEGALPRKTFSMGEAIEKRFYMECRKIS